MKSFPGKACLIILFVITISFNVNAQIDSLKIDSLKKSLLTQNEDTNKVFLLLEISGMYGWQKPDSSLLFAQQALKLSTKINYEEGRAYSKGLLGQALWILGDYLEADEFMQEILQFAESKHYTGLVLGTYASISSNRRDKGDYKDALYYSFKGDSLENANKPCQICGTFKVITGSIYIELNMADSALYYLKQGPDWGYTLWLFGRAYDIKGNNKQAYNYYLQSIAKLTSENNPKDLSNAYSSMAVLFKKEGNVDSCIYYGEKGFTTAYNTKYTKGMMETALLLSSVHEQTNPREALRYFKIASAAKDSLFNLQKTTQFLNSQFNEQLKRQQEEAGRTIYQNKIRTYSLLAALGFFLLLAILLYRNIRQKQNSKLKIEKAYQELQSTQAQLIQSEKMASLGELTAGIAHEIQNPLNFVNNFSEVNKEMIAEMKAEINKGNYDEVIMIADNIESNEEKINHHGKRADSIVKGMLQHSRQTKAVKEATDINGLCDEYLRLAYHGLRAKDKHFNSDFKTDFDDNIGKIDIVPQDIGRALLNLFSNAFYAVNEKKQSADTVYKPLVSVTTKKTGDKIEVIVKDNGNGISQTIIDKIFQPFFTTKPTGQGTGLGLSLAYDIITKEHNGTIKAESKEGEGSIFIIHLPVHA